MQPTRLYVNYSVQFYVVYTLYSNVLALRRAVLNSLKHRPVGQIRVVRHKHTAMNMNWLLCTASTRPHIIGVVFISWDFWGERSQRERPREFDLSNQTSNSLICCSATKAGGIICPRRTRRNAIGTNHLDRRLTDVFQKCEITTLYCLVLYL